jgi:hypothetical protein
MCVTPTITPTGTPTPNCMADLSGLIPGYCGSIKNDCLHEFCTRPVPPLRPNGLPDNVLVCKDDDPMCDIGPPGDKACTFRLAFCFNQGAIDLRAPCQVSGPVVAARLNRPNQGRPKDAVQLLNRDALEAVLVALGGVVDIGRKFRQVSFNPPLTEPVCTGFFPYKLPLGQSRSGGFAFKQGRQTVRFRVFPTRGGHDGDVLKLRCNP